MKKLVYFLIFALCVTLFSCTKDEVVTPNEQTAEIVTPNESAPDIATPDELPEEPDAIEPVETDENVIILPEADENTKYITIEFPEDFPEEPYVEPNLVSPEEFEWGEYGLFVRYSIDSYGELGKPIFDYSFLSRYSSTIEDGNVLYNNIDKKHKQIYDFEYDGDETIDYVPVSEQLPSVLSMITESKVIYISEDATEIGKYHLSEAKNYANGNTYWNGILEIYKNGVLAQTLCNENIENSGYRDYATGGFVSEDGEYLVPAIEEPQHISSKNSIRLEVHNNSEALLYEYYLNDEYYNIIYTEDSLKYAVKFNFRSYYINQIINQRYLIFTVFKRENHNVYMIDLESSEITRLMSYCFNPCVSPDMKYLAYTSYSIFDLGVNSRVQEDVVFPRGFYIKNLKTGITAYYPIPQMEETLEVHQPLGWINTKALLQK